MNKNKLFRWSIVAALAGFIFGFDTVVISGANQPIKELWHTSPLFHGFFIMSMALWGTVLGAIFGGFPTEKFGRKKVLLWLGILYTISAFGSALAPDPYTFSFFRFIGGIGIGVSSVAAPTYISEISTPAMRGRLGAMYQFNIVFGILIAFLSNYFLQGVGGDNDCAAIEKYKPGAARREIRDSSAPGLHLVIQPKPTGSKSWALRFRRPDGRPAKMWLGTVDLGSETKDEPVVGGALTLRQARQLASQIDRERARGIDVIEAHQVKRQRQQDAALDRAANTFGSCAREFFATYKTKHKQRPRRWREDAALFGLQYANGSDPASTEPDVAKGSLADSWSDKPVADIDGHDIHRAVDQARKLGTDSRARKLHVALSAFFQWLLQQRRITGNPARGVWRPGPPPDRERVLTDTEIVIFWQACDRIGSPYGALFKLLLLTGCRLREVARMTRSEIVDGVWTIPATRTKNHRPLSLPLPPLALQIIRDVPAIASDAGLVFTADGKYSVSGFSQVKGTLDRRMRDITGKSVPEFRLHDLRRTFATGLAALGVALPVIEKLLNHVSGSFGGIVGVYQKHEYAAEKAAALTRWARHIDGLVKGRRNVTPLRRAR